MLLNNDNYYSQDANKAYFSVSQIKDFMNCEASAIAKLNGIYQPKKSDAFLVGGYVDAYVEGTLEEWKESHKDEIYSKQNKKEKSLLAKFQQAENIIEVIKNDECLQYFLTGQKQTIMTGKFLGVDWKVKMDVYNPEKGFITDLKIMASLRDKYWNTSERCYENFVRHYRYDLQMLIYTAIEKIYTKRSGKLEPYLAVVTKQDPPDKAILNGFLRNDDVNDIVEELQYKLPRIIQVKDGEDEPFRCEICEYCRSTKKTSKIDFHELNII